MIASDKIYSRPARAAHWIAAILIVATFAIGLAMMSAPEGPGQDRLFDLHRSLGATILALTAARLLWRLRHPAPLLPADMPGWMRRAARASHLLLYLFMLGLPMLGWLGSSAFGAPVHIFGLFDLPPLSRPDRPLADIVLTIHKLGAFTLAGLVLLHVGAALYHLTVRRDGVFRQMTG